MWDFFQNGETCLHAAAISGKPALVRLLLEAGAEPSLTNQGGQTPIDLLMMFVNYGNITLTPNLLKVLHLLPATSVSSSSSQQEGLPIFPGTQKLHKLIRIYSPFSINKVSINQSPLYRASRHQYLCQRQETLDLPYLTLLCDNLKNRIFLQNFFS
jgi:ankyrin repeat protein